MKDLGRILIIGAGPTGIGAAYRLRKLGYTNFKVIDAMAAPGGLASSFVDDKGFTWDIGGHVQFSHYDYFDDAMNEALGKEGWLHHERESWVWMAERFVPYPFQNNLRYLPKDLMTKAIRGLVTRPPRTPSPNQDFGSWVLQTFGEGIRDIFMAPYNYKVWAFPLERLWAGWVGERVAVVDLTRALENIFLERDDLSWGPNNTFQFPKHGGTGAVWRALADQIGKEYFQLNTRVSSIDWKARKLSTDKGETLEYDTILSTMPLDVLAKLMTPAVEVAQEAAPKLLRSSSHIIGVGLTGEMPEKLTKKCWMYFPEDNCPFYRVTVFSNYSPNNVPDPQSGKYWSLMSETSESEAKAVNRETLVEQTIAGMLNTGLIKSRDQIVSTWHYTAEHGYPTPSLERNQLLQRIEPALAKAGVASRGRFGAWKYEVSNQDHSFMQGVEWINSMMLDVPETTVRFAETANSMWGKTRR
ncbi:MAG TPA: FAD-dependent oxidoreductase [Polyangiaceae bacterium]|nr:FAD-dependent oxidoreductase [Polyangiaceae bacterium]